LKFHNRALLISLLAVMGIISLIGLTWVNYHFSQQNPGGSDFLPRWVGTRGLLLTGRSPYSNETTQEIQQRFYGRPAQPDEDQVLFVYPLFSILVFAPFAMIADFNLARGLWMTVLELGIILIILGAIYLSRWKISPVKFGLLFVFGLLWYYSIRALINSNASILVGLFLVGVFLAIHLRKDILAGSLLALSTIKPQVVVLLVLFILIWSLREKRHKLALSFVGTLSFLVVITLLLVPGWIYQNLLQLLSYPTYTLPGTPGAIFEQWLPHVGKKLGWILTFSMIILLIWEWRKLLRHKSHWFLWTSYFTLTVTTLIGIRTATENYVVLLPAVILIFAELDQEWGKLGQGFIVVSYVLLFFGVWWLFLATLIQGEQPIQNSVMFFPLPLFLIIGLYLIRFQPRRNKNLSWT